MISAGGFKGGRSSPCSPCVKIIDKLFIGDIHSASDSDMLSFFGIVAIVNIGGGENKFPSEFKYLKIVMSDSDKSNIVPHLDFVVSFIRENRKVGGVLVHCKGGICRSASFLIAYLMVDQGLSMIHARGLVKEKRACIRPRPLFLSAIEKWAKKYKTNKTNKTNESKEEVK
jgi:hypothetical protein